MHGFDGMSLNDLVLASGMSKGAFNFHFSSKEGVQWSRRAHQERNDLVYFWCINARLTSWMVPLGRDNT